MSHPHKPFPYTAIRIQSTLSSCLRLSPVCADWSIQGRMAGVWFVGTGAVYILCTDPYNLLPNCIPSLNPRRLPPELVMPPPTHMPNESVPSDRIDILNRNPGTPSIPPILNLQHEPAVPRLILSISTPVHEHESLVRRGLSQNVLPSLIKAVLKKDEGEICSLLGKDPQIFVDVIDRACSPLACHYKFWLGETDRYILFTRHWKLLIHGYERDVSKPCTESADATRSSRGLCTSLCVMTERLPRYTEADLGTCGRGKISVGKLPSRC